MKRLIALLFLILFFTFAKPVLAEDFVIDSFNSRINIQNDGIVAVEETLNVDFSQNQKHGIFRDIPYIYQGTNGEKTYTEVTVSDVLRNNANEKYETQRDEDNIRIKIGDPDRTISGKHVYRISYTVKGVLISFPDHDEFYWNATGNEWPTTIGKATATITLPKDGLEKAACYQGYKGSIGECTARITSKSAAEFSTTELLESHQGMTIVAGYTKGLVPILTVARPKTFWEKFIEWPSQLTFWTGILGAAGFVVYTWYKKGRDPWLGHGGALSQTTQERLKPIGAHETVVVEFTPPDNLRPAEIGVLMDERAHTHDVIATIIDLATRGFLTITEVPKKWVFGSVDYELIKVKKDTAKLLQYEKVLLDNLFESGDSVKISSLKKTFYDELKEVKDQLYSDLIEKKFFPKNPEKVWENYFAIGFVLLIFGGVGLSLTIPNDLVFLADVSFALIVAGVLLVIFAKFMPRRTAEGRELYRRARGYRLFIDRAEKYRQRFFEKKNLFNEVLPYAIMFGLTDKFTHAMKDMGVKPDTTWYHSSRPFTYSSFNSGMNSFVTGVGTAIASTPSSSGGFSGGSSGGGFGGGGGGSW